MDEKPKRVWNAARRGTDGHHPPDGSNTRQPASVGRTIEPLLAPRSLRAKSGVAAPKPATPTTAEPLRRTAPQTALPDRKSVV